jgi:hypothetical protein
MEQIFISLNYLTTNPLNDITTDITTNPLTDITTDITTNQLTDIITNPNLNLKYNIPNIPKNGYIKFLF